MEKLAEIADRVVPPRLARKAGKSLERFRAHLAGRAAVAILLERLKIKGWVVPDPEFGFPRVVDQLGNPIPETHINISHSGDFAAAVIAATPVGIDIEYLKRDASRVMSRVVTPTESDWLLNHSEWKRGISSPLLLWCGKESVSKATGLGIVFGLNKIEIDVTSTKLPLPVHLELEGPQKLKNPSLDVRAVDQLLLAVCADKATLANGIDITSI